MDSPSLEPIPPELYITASLKRFAFVTTDAIVHAKLTAKIDYIRWQKRGEHTFGYVIFTGQVKVKPALERQLGIRPSTTYVYKCAFRAEFSFFQNEIFKDDPTYPIYEIGTKSTGYVSPLGTLEDKIKILEAHKNAPLEDQVRSLKVA